MSTPDGHSVSVVNKSAVVIGGTSGIGRAIALAFADEGANVIATSRRKESVEETAAELRSRGAETATVTCDIRNRNEIESLHDVATSEFGDIDILVNSAGTVAKESILDMSEEDWARDIDVCLTGVFRACQVFGQEMTTGSIINISSMSARQAREQRPAYCAAKSGVNGLTRAAAADLGPDIRVNAIAPGFVKTEMAGPKLDDGSAFREQVDERTPMNRVGIPDEISGAAIYLGSDAASFTTGEILTLDGGYDASAL